MTPADNRTYAMLAKPASSVCNLSCSYCYYLDKDRTLGIPERHMSFDILEAYVRQMFEMHGKDAVVEFSWHGGEPLTAGLPFFREALRLQDQYGQGRAVSNTIQTNATLISDEWCEFFKEHGFDVGVSIDGPERLHDTYRKTSDGRGSFARVMQGIRLLKKHDIPFATLTAVNRANMDHPLETYSFLRELTNHMQFLPVIEVSAPRHAKGSSPSLSKPYSVYSRAGRESAGSENIVPFSVCPEGFGRFLCAIWDKWFEEDRGVKHVQHFDVALENLKGIPPSLCVHSPVCGHSGSIEANGDVYACDRYAFPEYKLGNITEEPLREIMERNRAFGMHKTYGLPMECFDCPYVKLCFGGCPKDRAKDGLNYLCAGYKLLFAHITSQASRLG